MSRHAFLVRMALGRSPYEPVVEGSDQIIQPTSQGDSYVQQYSRRGQPINPRTIRENEALIAAKNEVLAAVGVCEKKDAQIDRLENHNLELSQEDHEARVSFSEVEWADIKDAENDYGEWIRLIAECSRNALTWWVVHLRRRIQVGIVSSHMSFGQILSFEWASLTQNGLRGALKHLAAGGLPEIFAQLTLTFFDWYLSESAFHVSKKILALKASSRTRLILLKAVGYGFKGLSTALHLLVYPLTAFSSLQQLGFISTSALYVPFTWLVPWHSSSPLRWAVFWRQDTQSPSSRLRLFLLSPTYIWLAMTLIQHASATAYGHVPLFEHECILGPHNEPIGTKGKALFAPFSSLRDKVLKALGWAADPRVKEVGVDALTEHRVSSDRLDAQKTIGLQSSSNPRVTELTMLPSHLLALNLDNIMWTVLLLPLDNAHLRTLVYSYLNSSAVQSNVQSGVNANAMPGLGAPGPRSNKVGLCLALQFAMDTAVWGGAYAWTRWIGKTQFYWGRT